MEIRTIKTENYSYTFVNQTRSDRYGFTHVSTIMLNDNEIGEGRQRWVNRTWEYFRYQTSMQNAIENLIDDRKDVITRRFKYENGVSRLTAKRREELEKLFAEDFLIKEYNSVLKQLERA